METVLRIIFGWILSALIVFLPYAGLRWGIPWLLETQLDLGQVDVAGAAERLVTLVNMNYWWIFLVYMCAAGIITPSYERENMGLFGTFFDNPFSYEDDFNRAMFFLMIVLAPGKVVWVTLHFTYVEIRDALFGGFNRV